MTYQLNENTTFITVERVYSDSLVVNPLMVRIRFSEANAENHSDLEERESLGKNALRQRQCQFLQ